MTTEIVQVTDFSAIENAIESWVSTGSTLGDLAPVADDAGNLWSRVAWEGFQFKRERPYATLSIVSDLSPGQSCVSQATITETVNKIQTTYKKLYKWNVQISFFQDSYNSDGTEIRTTARQYAKNLQDRYDVTPIKNILVNAGIAFHPLTRNIQGNVLSNIDDDKYIHQATIEFHFSGINEIQLKDTDYFISVTTPTVTYTGDNV